MGVHVDHAVDLRGYANCGSEHRPNFAEFSAGPGGPGWERRPGDRGGGECVQLRHRPVHQPVPDGIYLQRRPQPLGGVGLRLDGPPHAGWGGSAFERGLQPDRDGGAQPPAPADLDGDGRLEILFPSDDGRLHAYWLDQTEKGDWPYAVTDPAEGILRFALRSEAVADLDNDGDAEVIFPRRGRRRAARRLGKLHILDSLGRRLAEVDAAGGVPGRAAERGAGGSRRWRTSTWTPTWRWCC